MNLLIKNPFRYNYNALFDAALETRPQSLDVYIHDRIEHVEHLDFILNQLYHEIRTLSLSKGFDYMFDITVLFNVEPKHPVTLASSESELKSENDRVIDVKIDEIQLELPQTGFSQYDVCAVGGTFDHIHDGHKILLSAAVFLSKKKLIVGVTGPELLKNKKYAEYLDSFEKRQKSVQQLFSKLAHDQLLEIYKINDVCGPTGFVKQIDCLVLSGETKSGGEFVNNFRLSINYPVLKVFSINLIGGITDKLSSTDLRKADYDKDYK